MTDHYLNGFIKRAFEQGLTTAQVSDLLDKHANIADMAMKYLVNPVKNIPQNFKGYREMNPHIAEHQGVPANINPERHAQVAQMMEQKKREYLMQLLHGGAVAGAGVGALGMGANAMMGGQQ